MLVLPLPLHLACSVCDLLGQEAAAAVFLAAAAAAAAPADPSPAGLPAYSSMVAALPASIKVHTAHSNVPLLAPALTSCLSSSLGSLTSCSSSSSSPAYIAAACFPGCVQLLANVFTLRPASGDNGNSSDGGDGGGGGSSISVALPQLQAGVLHPAMVIKYWRQRGLAEDFGVLFGFAVKAYVRQVPFRWFCPLLAADVLINIAGCLKHGMLLHWLLPRYCAALLLPLALAAAQQVQGRRQFCARHGIEVQPGCRWLPGM
ncbi:hypothetical protein OEZ86_013540 [Tetradesmus obliquus]|nr:hypothetical protein OEZ86_013540 [Tetradesmus obliquus]